MVAVVRADMELFSAQCCRAHPPIPATHLVSNWGSSSKPQKFASASVRSSRRRAYATKALFNPEQDPIAQKAFKEPIAFWGGVFAALLRLDLKEDPLKEWIARTAESAGLDSEEVDDTKTGQDEAPQQIDIM